MKIFLAKTLILMVIIAGIFSCKATEKTKNGGSSQQQVSIAAAPVIIYKTNNDYRRNVPVILNEENTAVVSYPAPSDLYYRGQLAYPVELSGGFLLDQRGIDQNASFLDMTYTEYSKLQKAPHPDSLMQHVIQKDPLLIIYRCGNKNEYDNLEAQLNRMIEAADFSRCERLNR